VPEPETVGDAAAAAVAAGVDESDGERLVEWEDD